MGTLPGLCCSRLQSRPTGSPWALLLEVSYPTAKDRWLSEIAAATDKSNLRRIMYSYLYCLCVFAKLRERRPCTPSTWWRLVCRTRGPRDPLLESWCTRTALTVLRRCFVTKVSSASIEVSLSYSCLPCNSNETRLYSLDPPCFPTGLVPQLIGVAPEKAIKLTVSTQHIIIC